MIGISWGGFNSLQIAALNPPELKAIITVCSTDNRYRDDVHYMGGCLLGDNLSWASTMFARNTQPPDPEIVGEKWKQMWLERLNGSGLWLKTWLQHQQKDDYWKHGSISEHYNGINIPVLAVSGWQDGYSNSVFRMLQHLNVPRKGIIGPWSHMYPHFGRPGPAIGFLQESLRWWNHWLNGMYSGIMSEPMLSVWMQEYALPDPQRDYQPGRWTGLQSWPCEAVKETIFYLNPHHELNMDSVQEELDIEIQSPLSVGLNGGKWCSYSAAPDLPHDQRAEEGGALIFDSPVLEDDINIIGAPVVELTLKSNRPVAMVAIRLSEVSREFHATLITYGVLNLTHRNSHEHPEELVPDQKYNISIQLNDIAHLVKKGHRLRVSISTSYWPLAWPSPQPARLTITTGSSILRLPGIQDLEKDTMSRNFEKPIVAEGTPIKQLIPQHHNWVVKKDMLADTTTVEVTKDDGRKLLEDIGMEVSIKTREKYSYQYDNYDSVMGETHWEMRFERPGWIIDTLTDTVLTSDKDFFYIAATLDAYHNNARVHAESWNEKIPRNLV
jgi:putative CocE/NonD family hydrolase